uniref:Uncharacterized protein n=1 Tax=Arundo donax TaxID=35708 RepID=A0A0A8Z8C4_ARUDO
MFAVFHTITMRKIYSNYSETFRQALHVHNCDIQSDNSQLSYTLFLGNKNPKTNI